MADDPMTEAARGLVHQHLPTMDHVQVLLHLRSTPAGADQAALAAVLRLKASVVTTVLADLVAAGIVSRDAAGTYKSAPTTEATAAAVEALQTLYDTRPVTLVRMIYDRPPAALQSFADAFRIRPPER